MKKIFALSALAALLVSTSVASFAQAPSPHAKAPSDATGSGKDAGMNIQSGMSGNGGGGVGTVASASATGASTGGKSGVSKPKKSAKRSKKHRASTAAR